MPTVTGRATDYITFSRASNATVTGSDGYIKWAAHNLMLNSESFDTSYWSKSNILAFGSGSTANATAAPNGTQTADLITPNTTTGQHQVSLGGPVSFAGGVATHSYFVKPNGYTKVGIAENSATGYYATFNLSGSGSVLDSTATHVSASVIALANGWYQITAIISNATSQSSSLNILPASYTTGSPLSASWAGDGTSGIYLWGAHLYRSDLGGMVANTSAYPYYNPTTPKNLLGWTESFDNAAWAKTNILAFGSGSLANAATNPNGLQTADLIVPNTTSGIHTVDQTSYAIINNTPYQSSVYVKAAGYSKIGLFDNAAANRWATFNLSGSGSVIGNGASATGAITALSDGWYRVSLSENAGTTALAFTIYVLNDAYTSGNPSSYSYAGNGTSGIYLWGAQLSDSASFDTYVPVYGAAVTSAAYYGPRLDYDGSTLAAKGLLVEEQRTNLSTWSDDFSQGAWVKTNVTVTANTTVSPDGTADADTITSTTTSAAHLFGANDVSFTSGVSYTASIYMKRDTGRYVQITFGSGAFATSEYANFDLETGAVVGGDTSDASISNCGNGWYRIAYRGVSNNTNTDKAYYVIVTSASAARAESHTSALSVFAYGAQLEAGSFATSYIPTTSATVTRSADVAQVSTQAFPYSATEGTVVVAYDRIGVNRYSRLFNLGDASENNQVSLLNFNVGQENAYFVTGGSAAGVVAGPSIPSVNAAAKMGLAFKSGDSAISLNGASATAISSTFTPAATSLYIAETPVSGQYLNGHIRQITYIPRRLTNAELVSRTSA